MKRIIRKYVSIRVYLNQSYAVGSADNEKNYQKFMSQSDCKRFEKIFSFILFILIEFFFGVIRLEILVGGAIGW